MTALRSASSPPCSSNANSFNALTPYPNSSSFFNSPAYVPPPPPLDADEADDAGDAVACGQRKYEDDEGDSGAADSKRGEGPRTGSSNSCNGRPATESEKEGREKVEEAGEEATDGVEG